MGHDSSENGKTSFLPSQVRHSVGFFVNFLVVWSLGKDWKSDFESWGLNFLIRFVTSKLHFKFLIFYFEAFKKGIPNFLNSELSFFSDLIFAVFLFRSPFKAARMTFAPFVYFLPDVVE